MGDPYRWTVDIARGLVVSDRNKDDLRSHELERVGNLVNP